MAGVTAGFLVSLAALLWTLFAHWAAASAAISF
jgi:hypothetical protein